MTSASTTLRRLMKEAQELSASSSSPSPYFHAHPVSDSNLFDWHFTLAGPPAPSPYADGIYHGRIVLPPQYPLRPPSFRFLTPSGRFEVNREICLSISGHHDETWQPAWGIRTALTAIRSFMEGDAKGQVGGLDASEEARREWARLSRSWSCSICSEGKSNEDILSEWEETCREKGVDVDGQVGRTVSGEETRGRSENNEVPAGLKLSYRDEMNGSAATSTSTSTSVSASTPTNTDSTPTTANTTTASSQPSGNTAQTTVRTADHSATSSSRIPNNTQPSVHTDAPLQSSSTWLDWAIMGVLVALVAMILKKIIYARSEI